VTAKTKLEKLETNRDNSYLVVSAKAKLVASLHLIDEAKDDLTIALGHGHPMLEHMRKLQRYCDSIINGSSGSVFALLESLGDEFHKLTQEQ
jgi:hypothetical protein